MTENCFYCGTPLNKDNYTQDHLTPKSRGGDNRLSNLVPCCLRCNKNKKAKTLEEYRFYMTMQEFHSRTGVKFSAEQVAYLTSIGVSLNLKRHVFYAETE